MSSNEDIGAIFEEMATLLELTGANGFRVNAHTKVARVVEGLSSDLAVVARGEKARLSIKRRHRPFQQNGGVTGTEGNHAIRHISRLRTI